MKERFNRFETLVGEDSVKLLSNKKVIIFGVGGVGGYALEALVRSGIGHIAIVDADEVDITNINRQIIATDLTVGKSKVDVAEERAKSINPDIIIEKYKHFYLPEDKGGIDISKYDYVVDCIDTIKAKIDIISDCKKFNIPVISALGCGNRLDPSKLVYADLFETSDDGFAKAMRKECRKAGIESLSVVYSKEPAIKLENQLEEKGRHIPASSAFVPGAAGLMMASKVVRDFLKEGK